MSRRVPHEMRIRVADRSRWSNDGFLLRSQDMGRSWEKWVSINLDLDGMTHSRAQAEMSRAFRNVTEAQIKVSTRTWDDGESDYYGTPTPEAFVCVQGWTAATEAEIAIAQEKGTPERF